MSRFTGIPARETGDPPRYRMYIADTLDNGAGYCSSYSELNEFEGLIAYIESHLLPTYLSNRHADICRTSCPKCLRNYANRFEHHGLDWRLAVDLLNLLKDRDHKLTTTDEYWKSIISGRLVSLLEGLGQKGYREVDYGGTKIVEWDSKGAVLFPLHPLVYESSAVAQQIKLDVERDYDGMKCIFYSPYELERTQSATLSKIHEALYG